MVIARPTSLAGKILQGLRDGDFAMVVSTPVIQEFEDTLKSPFLRRKHRMSDIQIDAFIYNLINLSVLTPGALRLDIPALALRDPEDLKIVEAAVEGAAAYLVTQDKDLLSLEEWQNVRIVNVPRFYQILQSIRLAGPGLDPHL